MMLRTAPEYIERQFSPVVFAGLRGLHRAARAGRPGVGNLPVTRNLLLGSRRGVSGLRLRSGSAAGLGMTQQEAAAAISAGAGPGTEAYEAYYGSGGYYSQAESVQRAAEIAEDVAAATMPSPPMMYAQEECAVTDQDCVARNSMRQQANMVILANYNKAIYRANCQASQAVSEEDLNCGRSDYQDAPVPAAPGTLALAVCSGNQCYAPIVGDVSQTEAASAKLYASQYTSTGVPKTAVLTSTAATTSTAGNASAVDAGAQSTLEAATGSSTGTGSPILWIALAAAAAFLLGRGR